MNDEEMARLLTSRCVQCKRPLYGIPGPVICSTCEPEYNRERIVELQSALIVLMKLHGNKVEISAHEVKRVRTRMDNITTWWDRKTGNLHVESHE